MLPLAWSLPHPPQTAGFPWKFLGEKVVAVQQDGGAHAGRSSGGKRVRYCRAAASRGAFLHPQRGTGWRAAPCLPPCLPPSAPSTAHKLRQPSPPLPSPPRRCRGCCGVRPPFPPRGGGMWRRGAALGKNPGSQSPCACGQERWGLVSASLVPRLALCLCHRSRVLSDIPSLSSCDCCAIVFFSNLLEELS